MRTVTLALVALVVVAPASARAFHDPDEYGHEAMVGGGAHTWFTGSPRFAGYDCSMCHVAGRERPQLALSSLPDGLFETGRYVPEAEYRITVRLEGATRGEGQSADRNAFTAEALADDGAAAGTLDVADDRVELVDDGRVVGPSASFASGTEWTFTWTAPSPGAGPASLHVAAVDGDSDGTPAGDDVATFARRFTELGAAQSPAVAPGYDAAGCTAIPGASSGVAPWLLALAVALASGVRRRP